MQKDGKGNYLLDPDESALDAFCMAHGGNLVSIDERIAAIPDGDKNLDEILRRRRRLADALLKHGNLDAAEGWLYALLDGLKALVLFIPKVKKGSRQQTAEFNKQVAKAELELVRRFFEMAQLHLESSGAKQCGEISIMNTAMAIATKELGPDHKHLEYITRSRIRHWRKPPKQNI